MSNLWLRLISAIILIGVSLGATWAGGDWFLALCLVGAILIYVETVGLAESAVERWIAAMGYGVLLIFFVVWIFYGPKNGAVAGVAGLAIIAGTEFAVSRKLWVCTGLAYSFLPFVAMVSLRGDRIEGLYAMVFVFACVWGADTFAYFTGRKIGGPKLAPTISPNKTWSGFFGGLFGAIVVSSVANLVFGLGVGLASAFTAMTLGLVSSIGDLAESALKRHFGKKDSGRIIPGHGGFLDRIDALIFAAIAAWVAGAMAGGRLLEPGSTGEAFVAAFMTP